LFNKDYIMRMIEMLVQGIAKIMRLKQEKKYEECGAVLTDTLRQFYGLNDRSVENLPWTDLMAVANLGGLPDAEKCALLAQLIREKAELEELNGRKDVSVSLYFKALCIYASAVLADNDFNIPVHRENIDGIAAIAGKYALPADALRLLVQYYELTGRQGRGRALPPARAPGGARGNNRARPGVLPAAARKKRYGAGGRESAEGRGAGGLSQTDVGAGLCSAQRQLRVEQSPTRTVDRRGSVPPEDEQGKNQEAFPFGRLLQYESRNPPGLSLRRSNPWGRRWSKRRRKCRYPRRSRTGPRLRISR